MADDKEIELPDPLQKYMLTKRHQDLLSQKLLHEGWPKACNWCGSKTWTFQDRLFEWRAYSGGGIRIGGGTPTAPVAIASCETCGQMIAFAAVFLGLIKMADGELIDG